MDRRGMTLLEVIISMLILSTVTIGIANVFIASKRHIGINRSKIVAAELGRYYMDVLQLNVTQDDWRLSSNNLTQTLGVYQFNDIRNQNMNYTIKRRVDYPFEPGMNIHRVNLTIAWNETS